MNSRPDVEMSDEAMRVAIAEACGKKPQLVEWWAVSPDEKSICYNAESREEIERWLAQPNLSEHYAGYHAKAFYRYPDYLNSLDAMHEAEKAAGFHEEDSKTGIDYWINLGHVTGRPTKEPGKTYLEISEVSKCCATARQRATAFLATIQQEVTK